MDEKSNGYPAYQNFYCFCFSIGMLIDAISLMTNGLPFSILVVDDDEDDRIMIDDAFQQIHYDAEVKKFADGKKMLQYLEQVGPELYPSLIILDNTLPQLEAEDILSILKRDPAAASIPVVIYSTSLSPSKKEHLLSLGAYACYEKGNKMEEILKVVKEFRKIAEGKVNVPHSEG
jgi:CheY-like chemotaxis protein